jgi:signal transduction histidine kinase
MAIHFNRALGRALGLRFDNLLLSDRLERVPFSKVGNQAKLRFFAAMGHEPRVPLNAILGFSEIIRSKMFAPVDPSQHSSQHPSQHPRQQKDDVEGISESAARLLKMIDEIRMLSGIESGGVEREEKPLDLRAAVVALLEDIREVAEAGGRQCSAIPAGCCAPTFSASDRSCATCCRMP